VIDVWEKKKVTEALWYVWPEGVARAFWLHYFDSAKLGNLLLYYNLQGLEVEDVER
jgi:hypothetical protein